jgi:hypothetical protein
LAVTKTVLHVGSRLLVGDGSARQRRDLRLATEFPVVPARSGQHPRHHPPRKAIAPPAPVYGRATPDLRLEPAANLVVGAGHDGCR